MTFLLLGSMDYQIKNFINPAVLPSTMMKASSGKNVKDSGSAYFRYFYFYFA